MDCGAKEKALAEQIEELTSQANRLAMIDVVQDHQRDFVIKRNRHLSRLKTQAGIAPLQNNDKWTSLGKSFSGDNDES